MQISGILRAMARKSDAELYEEGITLFNEGRFFECHEAWEELWMRSDGADKVFYQGLIQAAVAILHAQRGNLEGAASLYEKSRAKLDSFPDVHMGIALGEFRTTLAEFISARTSTNPKKPMPAPRLRVHEKGES